MSYPWKTTTPRRSTAETSPGTGGGRQHAYGRADPPQPASQPVHGAARAHSNPRTPGHTWTGAASTRNSCMTATRPCASSPIVVGAGGWPLAKSHRLSALRAPLTPVSTTSTQRVIGRLSAPAPGMEPRPPTTAPAAAVPTAAVPTAAVPTGRLHGGGRGDGRRLGRSGSGRGDRCGTDSDRGSARRQHRRDVLQSDSHNQTSFRWSICPCPSRFALHRTDYVTADPNLVTPAGR